MSRAEDLRGTPGRLRRHVVHRYGGDARLLGLSLLVGIVAGLGALAF